MTSILCGEEVWPYCEGKVGNIVQSWTGLQEGTGEKKKEIKSGGRESSVVENRVLEDGNGRKICLVAEESRVTRGEAI